MIDGLFQPMSAGKDDGMIRRLLEDFYQSTPKVKPKHIIIFRDGMWSRCCTGLKQLQAKFQAQDFEFHLKPAFDISQWRSPVRRGCLYTFGQGFPIFVDGDVVYLSS